jgi:hypothetical protein
MLTKEQMQMVTAEIDRQRIALLLKVAIGNRNTQDDYATMITQERYKMQVYHQGGVMRGIGNAVTVVWACLWYGLYALADYLTREV